MANDIIEKAFERHLRVFEESKSGALAAAEKAANILLGAVREGRMLFTCGNGGSAADAQHFAAEFICKYKEDRRPYPAVALTTDTSCLTALGNDYGFDAVFSRQVSALGKKGDVLVAFSTSGTSKNIIAAIREAKARGLWVIALTGEGGRDLERVVDALVCIPSRETARIQEMHELFFHTWCEFIDSELGARREAQ